MTMPEIDGATQIISTVGFPIFCVLVLGLFIWKAFNMVMQNNKEREAKLYDTIAEIRGQLKEASATNASFVKILENMSRDIEDIKDKIKE
jgi:F0F1-type ATP synthase membrane subunit b/b'